jgi:hypothetical protein
MKFRKNKKNNQRNPDLKKSENRLPVNNYYRSPRTPAKATVIEKENDEKSKKFPSLSKIINFFIIGGVVCLVVFATTLNTSPVVELRKNNAKYYESQIYEQKAQEIIKSNFLNRSKLLFQQTSFENQLKVAFPEISNVTPVMPLGGRSLTVIISVSEPFAYVSSGENTGIMNGEGVLVVKNGQSLPQDLIKLRFTEPQSNFEVGSRILTGSEVELISLLDSEMSDLTFKDGSIAEIDNILFNVADGQLEARLKNKNFYIKLSTFSDSEIQVGGAKATLRQLDKEDKLPSQYIDVRVPGRALVL